MHGGDTRISHTSRIAKASANGHRVDFPAILSDAHRLLCAYYVSERVIPQGTVAVLRFEGLFQFRRGYPNDEALHGHPLAKFRLEH